MNDEDFININVNDVVNEAFELSKTRHAESIKREYQRREDEIL